MQNTWTPTIVGSIVMVLAYPIYSWAGANHGGLGLALVSSGAISIYVVALAVILRRSSGATDSPRIYPVVIKMMPAALFGWWIGRVADSYIDLHPLLEGALLGMIAMSVCLLVAWALRVKEIGAVVALVTRKIKR
jgi:peptidoglycan biosynthesis protein MviN/MurJ (putative lipid II flippase)